MAEHEVTKTPFSQTILVGLFPEILVEDVKLMPNMVLKVLRRSLLSFLSARGNTGGGGGVIFTTQRCAG